MKTIFNDYSPLRSYFKDNVFKSAIQSKSPFLSLLTEFNVDTALNYLKNSSETKLASDAVKNLTRLEQDMKKNIKAYRSFLKNKNKFINKKNYLTKYPLTSLIPDESYDYIKMISVSSGSSGEPFFWPRGEYLELETTFLYELILKDCFQIDKNKTLLINAYSMGMYVAGVFTLNACLRIALRGYPLSIINPGISLEDVLRIITEMGKYYDQIIICGYPPFIKDVIEDGIRQKINWGAYNLKFIFGAESISEDWRSYLFKRAKIKDYYHSSINTYGSADAAILGHETPFSILIKTICSGNQDLLNKVFNGKLVSTFIQYHPNLKYFENNNNELLFSCVGGIPLFKYRIHDAGNIISFSKMVQILNDNGINILKIAKEEKIEIWKLPFIVLYGKSDQTITIYGLNVYPQTVRTALESYELMDYVTARMTMQTKYNRLRNQYIEIIIELQKNIKPAPELKLLILEIIFKTLIKYNYEYKTLYEKLGEKVKPRIVLVPYASLVKNRGVKQKWIQKEKS